MMAKQMKTLKLYYPLIQCLKGEHFLQPHGAD